VTGRPPRRPRLEAYGDAACLVSFGRVFDEAVQGQLLRLAAEVRADAALAWGEPVPSYESLLVPYDPVQVEAEQALRRLGELVAALSAAGAPVRPRSPGSAAEPEVEPEPEPEPLEPEPEPLDIPVRYGGPDGPDLEAVCAALDLRPAELIELHASRPYRVWFLGFVPGFAYLGPLPARLVTVRRARPRERVPPGSVAIAGRQTAVYPLASPGGWNLIGRTDVRLWDLQRDPPALLRPGGRVRFVPRRG
jgi:inhibitor of KinA